MWFVKFYAPWCGHCKKLEPVWNQVAQSLHSSSVRVGRVDCTRYTSVANEYKVSAFPTLLFLKGEKVYVYNGDRTKEEIVDFAVRMAGPPVRQFENPEDILDAKKKHLVFFLYVGSTETELREIYEQLATSFQTSNYFYSVSPEIAKEIEELNALKGPQSLVFKDGIYNKAKISETEDANATLTKWVVKERFVLFPKISHGNLQPVLSVGKFLVLAVLEENKANSITPTMAKCVYETGCLSVYHNILIRFRNLLSELIKNNKDKYYEYFQFGWIGQPEIANSIAMMLLPIPSLLIINSTTYQYYLPDDDPEQLTVEVITNFLDQILNNTVTAYGGDTFLVRLYRAYFEAKTSLADMWRGNPVLTAVLFGMPLGFLSLICYSICCSDILEASEEDELVDRERRHVKKE
uniref:Thioredoxin domain-containing protein n=1 Tax=Strigamia maritima TaxID=126957 RepID=T1J252_STRMM